MKRRGPCWPMSSISSSDIGNRKVVNSQTRHIRAGFFLTRVSAFGREQGAPLLGATSRFTAGKYFPQPSAPELSARQALWALMSGLQLRA